MMLKFDWLVFKWKPNGRFLKSSCDVKIGVLIDDRSMLWNATEAKPDLYGGTIIFVVGAFLAYC